MNSCVKDILKDDFWIMPQTPEYIEEGIPYITSKNIKNGKIDFSKVNYISQEAFEKISKNRPILVGDILISMIGTLGETAEVIVNDGMFYGQNMFLVRLDESKIDKRYFLNYFKSNYVKRVLAEKQNQSTQKYLKANHIEDLHIPILPLVQQKQIAAILDKISSLIFYRQQQLQQLDELVKARFVELFWSSNEVVRLDSLIKPYRADKCEQNTYPVLSITMHNGLVLQSERFKKEIASGDKSQYKVVPRNKLVVAFPIDEGLLSAQTIVDVGIVSPAYSLYDIDENKIYPEVLEYILRSDLSIQYYKSKLRGTTLRRRMIPKSDFDSMPINLPSMDRQKQFLNEIKEIDKSKVVVQKALDKSIVLYEFQ